MKKITILTALLAACSAACAQSSVTLFGIVDAAVQHGSGSNSSLTQLGSGAASTSRLGFRGVENLGGSLSAGFHLEAGITVNNGTGAATNTNNQSTGAISNGALSFNRRSTVSLMSDWGEVRLGRDFSAQYYNRFVYDPFGNNGVGATQTVSGQVGSILNRVSNSFMYFLPDNIGGLYGMAQVYLGGNADSAGASKNDGSGVGGRIGWKKGEFDIAAAHVKTDYAKTSTYGGLTTTNIGARYGFGTYSVVGGYFRDRMETIAGVTGRGGQVGATYRTGPIEFRGQYSTYKTSATGNPESKKVSFGYVYYFSTRTSVYGTYARTQNSGGASSSLNGASTGANQPSTGYDFGIRHIF